ncbi:pirin family protein [Aquincola tertiaricarbonis]|uniref:pirin family protein n=1 Tax=Aquincola tertiaricarbonis TaxID=391953 RepID=UPI0006153BFF|nr:pirin family protein [Aquincola tertiaricarbonis]
MIELVIEQRRVSLGSSFEVGRVLPFAKRRMVGPFIFFDHIGPLDLAPGLDRRADVRAHPHIGLATVTYLFSGQIMHRDSLGCTQPIRPQEVNWMTAGRGITHSERFEHARVHGDHLHGIQAWVALPTELEETAPSFSHHSGSSLPQWDDAGVAGHLIAGSAHGLTAAAETLSPLFYLHLEMTAGSTAEVPAPYSERAVYVASGRVEVDGRHFEAGKMIVLRQQASRIRAAAASTVMMLGGEPVGQRYLHWNFVSSTQERLVRAAEDWKAGRMRLPVADDQEFIPLPDGPVGH